MPPLPRKTLDKTTREEIKKFWRLYQQRNFNPIRTWRRVALLKNYDLLSVRRLFAAYDHLEDRARERVAFYTTYRDYQRGKLHSHHTEGAPEPIGENTVFKTVLKERRDAAIDPNNTEQREHLMSELRYVFEDVLCSLPKNVFLHLCKYVFNRTMNQIENTLNLVSLNLTDETLGVRLYCHKFKLMNIREFVYGVMDKRIRNHEIQLKELEYYFPVLRNHVLDNKRNGNKLVRRYSDLKVIFDDPKVHASLPWDFWSNVADDRKDQKLKDWVQRNSEGGADRFFEYIMSNEYGTDARIPYEKGSLSVWLDPEKWDKLRRPTEVPTPPTPSTPKSDAGTLSADPSMDNSMMIERLHALQRRNEAIHWRFFEPTPLAPKWIWLGDWFSGIGAVAGCALLTEGVAFMFSYKVVLALLTTVSLATGYGILAAGAALVLVGTCYAIWRLYQKYHLRELNDILPDPNRMITASLVRPEISHHRRTSVPPGFRYGAIHTPQKLKKSPVLYPSHSPQPSALWSRRRMPSLRLAPVIEIDEKKYPQPD